MIEFREALLSDAAKIAEIMSRSIDCAWTTEQVCEEIENPAAPFFVAVDGGMPVGFLSGVCAADECEISDIAVDAAYRRQNIASRLFALMFDNIVSRGVRTAYLLVRADNAPALALYGKLGFLRTGVRRGYYGGGADAVVMRKEL